MSTTATAPVPGGPGQGRPEQAKERQQTMSGKPVTWKLPVTLLALAFVAFIFFGLMGPRSTAKFGISSGGDFFQLPAIEVPAYAAGIVLSVILLGLAGYAVFLKTTNVRPPRWLPVVFTVVSVVAFLIWVVGGAGTPSPSRFRTAARSSYARGSAT